MSPAQSQGGERRVEAAARRDPGGGAGAARARRSRRPDSRSCSSCGNAPTCGRRPRDHRAAAATDFPPLTIDKGTRDGLRPDMAVIAPNGRRRPGSDPSARSAKVQLIIDHNAARAPSSSARARRASSSASAKSGSRCSSCRRRPTSGRRRRRDVGITRSIEGIRDRARRIGREERSGVQAHRREAGGRFFAARGSPGRADPTRRKMRPPECPSEAGRDSSWPSSRRSRCRRRSRGFSSAARSPWISCWSRSSTWRLTSGPDRASCRARRGARAGALSSRVLGIGGWPRRLWGSWRASSARSSSSRSRCRGSSCSSAPASRFGGVKGLYALLDLRQFGSPYARLLANRRRTDRRRRRVSIVELLLGRWSGGKRATPASAVKLVVDMASR